MRHLLPAPLRGMLMPKGAWRYVVALLATHRLALRRKAAQLARERQAMPPPWRAQGFRATRDAAGRRARRHRRVRAFLVSSTGSRSAAPLLEADINGGRIKRQLQTAQDMPRACAQTGSRC